MMMMETEKQNNEIWKVRLFGRFEVSSQNGILDDEKIRSEMVTKLLSYIFCHRKRNITIQELGDALWHDDGSDNPAGALKNLMYRLRTIMKKEWGRSDFIVTGRGTYTWNPELHIEIDAEKFEKLCKNAPREENADDEIADLEEAVRLYRGTFLPKLNGEYWVASLATYYHSMFLTAVKRLAGLLEEHSRYDEMSQICSRSIELDALDEELHCWLIKALSGQNKQNLAIEHYQKTVDLLYDNLGVRPSEELRGVYETLLKQKHEQELDLSKIQKELKSDDDGRGAFLCEYGVFKKSYHLEIRRAGRLGMSIYLSLITLYPSIDVKKDSAAYTNIINKGMDIMQQVLLGSLRTGDVISRYSSTQFIIMLPTCQYETAMMVMERIQNRFYSSDEKTKIKLQYSVDEIDLSKL